MRRKKKRPNKISSKLRTLLPASRVLEDRTAARDEPVQASDVSDSAVRPISEEHARFLADLGTGLWRLRQRLVQPGSGDPSEQMRWAYRHLEAVWDVLTQAGIEVQDHTGTPFDPGLSLKVIAFQPTAGIERESVTETIRPSMYYKGKPIQMGEVIVGTPERPQGETSNKETRDESATSDVEKWFT